MALTQAQINAHLRLIVVQNFTDNEDGLGHFLKACRDYAVAGGPDEREAASTIARAVYERVIGRVPTTDDIHILQRHRVISGGDIL